MTFKLVKNNGGNNMKNITENPIENIVGNKNPK